MKKRLSFLLISVFTLSGCTLNPVAWFTKDDSKISLKEFLKLDQTHSNFTVSIKRRDCSSNSAMDDKTIFVKYSAGENGLEQLYVHSEWIDTESLYKEYVVEELSEKFEGQTIDDEFIKQYYQGLPDTNSVEINYNKVIVYTNIHYDEYEEEVLNDKTVIYKSNSNYGIRSYVLDFDDSYLSYAKKIRKAIPFSYPLLTYKLKNKCYEFGNGFAGLILSFEKMQIKGQIVFSYNYLSSMAVEYDDHYDHFLYTGEFSDIGSTLVEFPEDF